MELGPALDVQIRRDRDHDERDSDYGRKKPPFEVGELDPALGNPVGQEKHECDARELRRLQRRVELGDGVPPCRVAQSDAEGE